MEIKNKVLIITVVFSLLLIGCKSETYIFSNRDREEQTNKHSYFDYDDLGVEKYNYDEEFSLNSNLESAIEVLATYGKYEVKSIDNEDWKKWFVDSYIQSMFDGYDYKKRVLEEQAGYMTREQVEYVSYSLTGDYIEFDSIDDKGINCNEALSSPSESFVMDDYTYSIDGKKIVVKANCHQYKKGSASEHTFLITTVLIKNPYSCFDGYSIESMDAEDVSPLEYGDGEEHEVNVYFSGIDYYENKVSVEYWSSDDDIEYAMFITVLVNGSQMNYLLENKQCNFSITYMFDEKMTSPVAQITAKEIRKIDKQ